MEREHLVKNSQNGSANGDRASARPDRSIMQEIVRYPAMRNVLGRETVDMYPDALRNLGVPEVDIKRNTRSLVETLNSPRNHFAERIDAVYEAKKAAERHKSKTPEAQIF